MWACSGEADALPASGVQQALSITASEPFDLTATFAFFEAIQNSARLLDMLRSLANAPHQLEAALDGSLHERGSAHASACGVRNDTGIPLQCWLSTPVHPEAKEPGTATTTLVFHVCHYMLPHSDEASHISREHCTGLGHGVVVNSGQHKKILVAQRDLTKIVSTHVYHPGEEGIVLLEPGGQATLSLPSVVSPSCQSQLASCPELFFEEDQAATLAASGSLAALQKAISGR